MSPFRRSLAEELDHLSRDPWDQALLFVLPLLLLGLMAAMLLDGVPRNLPIAVVGGGDGPAARQLIQALDEAPGVAVAARVRSADEALSLVRRGRIIAFVELPSDLAPRDQPIIRIRYNAAYLSSGGLAEGAAAQALTATLGQRALADSGVPDAAALRLADLPLSVTIIANPQASFEWYLQALVDPAVLHLLIACAAAMAMGRALEDGSLGEWAVRTGGGPGALAGKLVPYVAIVSAWGAAWLIWIAGFRSWQPHGSLALIVIGQTTLFAATAAISAMLVALARETSTALAVSAIYAGSALAYSGGSLPVGGGSLFARGWSRLLPFTHYLDLQMDQWLGAPPAIAAGQLAILSIYLVVPAGVTLLLLRRASRR